MNKLLFSLSSAVVGVIFLAFFAWNPVLTFLFTTALIVCFFPGD